MLELLAFDEYCRFDTSAFFFKKLIVCAVPRLILAVNNKRAYFWKKYELMTAFLGSKKLKFVTPVRHDPSNPHSY